MNEAKNRLKFCFVRVSRLVLKTRHHPDWNLTTVIGNSLQKRTKSCQTCCQKLPNLLPKVAKLVAKSCHNRGQKLPNQTILFWPGWEKVVGYFWISWVVRWWDLDDILFADNAHHQQQQQQHQKIELISQQTLQTLREPCWALLSCKANPRHLQRRTINWSSTRNLARARIRSQSQHCDNASDQVLFQPREESRLQKNDRLVLKEPERTKFFIHQPDRKYFANPKISCGQHKSQ